MRRNICIIPARGGSKRIPRKNVKDFLGKPIIAYSIEAAIASKLFDVVMVSTDDDEIARIARAYGAEVPFLRAQDDSGDFAPLSQVFCSVLEEYKKIGKDFDFFCCILPTAPLLSSQELIDSFKRLSKTHCSVISIVEFDFPIQRYLKFDGDKLAIGDVESYSKRSQDLPSCYHDAGQLYWAEAEGYLKHRSFFALKPSGFLLDSAKFIDIDTLSDWKKAEFVFKYNYENKREDL